MQSTFTIAMLAGIASAFYPTEVKEDLDAHPWRPIPGIMVRDSLATGTATSKPTWPTAWVEKAAWQLQIAALSSLEAAKNEQKRLETVLGPGKIEILTEGSVHRVRYGSFPSKESAEAAREELRAKGIETFSVRKL